MFSPQIILIICLVVAAFFMLGPKMGAGSAAGAGTPMDFSPMTTVSPVTVSPMGGGITPGMFMPI